MTTSTTTDVERYRQSFTELEETTLLGFLAGYRGFTRGLRPGPATVHRLVLAERPPAVRGAPSRHRMLRSRPRGPWPGCATVARRLSTVVSFYRYAEEEGAIGHSPAVHIRRPRIDYESHVAHLDRNELGTILVAAGISSPETMRSSRCWR